ncbi:MAG TPA: hypothetical protein VN345_17870, partial [Blastocatellia bacterium]|nr:hypothetical protein [Blastocatellia bacterium]
MMSVYDRLRTTDSEDKAETGRRIKRSLANVRRGEYTDYDEEGLRGLVKQVIAELETEKRGRKKRMRGRINRQVRYQYSPLMGHVVIDPPHDIADGEKIRNRFVGDLD